MEWLDDIVNKFHGRFPFDDDLIAAILRNDVEEVKRLIQTKQASPQAEIKERLLFHESFGDIYLVKSRVLHLAVCKKNVEIADILIKEGAGVVDVTGYLYYDRSIAMFNSTPLMIAAFLGDEDMAELLLSHGADPNKTDFEERSALFYACETGHENMAKMLIQAMGDGIDLNELEDEYGFPLLFSACLGGEKLMKAIFPQLTPTPFKAHNSGGVGFPHIVAKSGDFNLFVSLVGEDSFDINMRDRNGRSVLHYACMSKREGADDLIKYLIDELHFSVDDAEKDSFGIISSKLPMEFVCEYGRVSSALAMLERGATFGSKDERGWSPLYYAAMECNLDILKRFWSEDLKTASDRKGNSLLHLACGSGWVTVAIIEFLVTEKGLDVNALNNDGRNALSLAIENSNDVSPVKFLCEVGSDIECRDKKGNTPFLHAASFFDQNAKIRMLIEKGVDVEARNKDDENALHIFSKKNEIQDLSTSETLMLLLKAGVNPESKNKHGRVPYEEADGLHRVILKKAYIRSSYSRLLDRETVKPQRVKMCVIGAPKAGKTTLVNALQNKGILPVKAGDRTAGIEVYQTVIPGLGILLVWDFAGQKNFHGAHAIFFNPTLTIFVLVLDVSKGEDAMEKEARYWLGFVESACRIRGQSVNGTEVVLVGNERKGLEDGDMSVEPGLQLRKVQQAVQDKFRHVFNIRYALEIDCIREKSPAMQTFRETLKTCQSHCIESAEEVPKLCEYVGNEILPTMRKTKCVMESRSFVDTVAEEIEKHLPEEAMKVLLKYLDSTGEIVDLKEWVCLSIGWLSSNIVGPLLSPDWFPITVCRGTDGKTTKAHIESALQLFDEDKKQSGKETFPVSGDDAVKMLMYLELCFEVYGEEELYQIPALIQEIKPHHGWQINPEMTVYRGRRYRCTVPTDIVPPGVFAFLQCRCSSIKDSCHDQYELWKGGIYLVKAEGSFFAECLISLRDAYSAVDVVVRCDGKSISLAKKFWEDVQRLIEKMRDEKSPGLPMTWWLLHSEEVASLRFDEVPETMYSCTAIDGKREDDIVFAQEPRGKYAKSRDLDFCHPVDSKGSTGNHRTMTSVSSDARKADFPASDSEVTEDLARSVARVASHKWDDIAAELIPVSELDQLTGTNKVKLLRAINNWKLSTDDPSVGKLLFVLENCGISRARIKKEFGKQSDSSRVK